MGFGSGQITIELRSDRTEFISKFDLLMHVYKRKYNAPEYRKKYTGIYGSWYAMKQRCKNPKHKQFCDYGGRGIAYDSSWETFANFKRDMEEGYIKGLTIERINNQKGYFKENCRWATRGEQNRNKRCNIVIEYAGQKKTLLEWHKFLNMDVGYSTLRQRYYSGMEPAEILETNLYRPQKISK